MRSGAKSVGGNNNNCGINRKKVRPIVLTPSILLTIGIRTELN